MPRKVQPKVTPPDEAETIPPVVEPEPTPEPVAEPTPLPEPVFLETAKPEDLVILPESTLNLDNGIVSVDTTIHVDAPIPDGAPVISIDPEIISIRKEKLLKVRAIVPFEDGNLREFMEQYGYKVYWPANEVRNLPKWLLQRCVNSGAELEKAVLDDGEG